MRGNGPALRTSSRLLYWEMIPLASALPARWRAFRDQDSASREQLVPREASDRRPARWTWAGDVFELRGFAPTCCGFFCADGFKRHATEALVNTGLYAASARIVRRAVRVMPEHLEITSIFGSAS